VTDQAEAGLQSIKFPWSPVGDFAANLAIGNLRESVLLWLRDERGVHAETLFVVMGALAGQAAAQAFWDRSPIMGVDFMDIGTRDGRHFFFGDALNAYIVRERGSVAPLWDIVAGGAVTAGCAPSALPDWKEIFTHGTQSLGSPAFGIVRTPAEHQPAFQPMQALQQYWPMTRKILSQPAREGVGPSVKSAQEKPEEPASAPRGGFAQTVKGMFGKKKPQPGPQTDIWGETLARQHWPIVVGLVTQRFIGMTKDVLDPGWAVRIFMEAAVPMSKLHPREIPQELPQ
jgi:hypothetical protein